MRRVVVSVSDDFFEAFANIPKAQQRKMRAFINKFRANPESPGINYEVIRETANPNYRSIRIDQAYRGIVLKPDTGNVYILMWVAHHDDAYDWAKRTKCEVNPETGTLQVYSVEHAELLSETKPAAPPTQAPEEVALFDLRDRELRRLGVPDDRMDLVKSLSSIEELERVKAQLPIEVYEALSFLALGMSLEEVMNEYALPIEVAVIDPTDIEAALEREHSLRTFVVPEDEEELQRMLEAPLEKWRVFLHPTQRRLVNRDWNGPVRVLGGAGTGKTVVAMHRARWLAKTVLQPGEKLIFTTFTRNLATDIETNLKTLCTPEEMGRIHVTNIDAWVANFLAREQNQPRIVYSGDDTLERCWDRAIQLLDGAAGVTEDFVSEEWRQVILPQRITTRSAYFQADRRGRGTPLTRRQRAALWPVFEEMRLQLHQAKIITSEDAMFLVADMLKAGQIEPMFKAAVIDEAQDLGPEVLHLLRAMVPEGKNDIFLVGDGHQRIYSRRASLRSSGINIIGRGRKLRINYRTTDEIRKYATAILRNQEVDDLDDGVDDLVGYKSLVRGEQPNIHSFSTFAEELAWLAQAIQELEQAEQLDLREICVAARTNALLNSVQKALEQAGIRAARVSRSAADNIARVGVRLATIHRIKGLEFRHVFVVGASADHIPPPQLLRRASDDVERAHLELRERALLHVATTRAIRSVNISWSGAKSPLLPDN